ncbi:MAG: glutamate decarboxylase [Solirubrobacterales bacterium]|nr:glutamate decarboxylase [Solirubrobacterales bacterium]
MALHETHDSNDNLSSRPVFAIDDKVQVPKYSLPDGEMSQDAAYQLVHDEVMLDGNARLNTATFVTTWMEQEARQLINETLDKNMIDKDEYPQTAELERRCVNIIGRLWHADEGSGNATGTSTIGSSEAAMLAGMALKWKWRERMKAAGKSTERPNLVMGTNVQVCWEKFCRYWDIEPRMVPVEEGRMHLTADKAVEQCDENTIGVVAILGSTFDGSYEPVDEISAALDELQAEQGLDIPIHVDAASGGFVAPFIQEDLVWDFRLPRVKSINSSGHKYGLVYPGVGWVVWRNKESLPEELIFKVNYLGGEMPTFAINFSRPGAQIIAQYYMFLRLGRDGYKRVQSACQGVAMHLADGFEKSGPYEALTRGDELPVIAVRLKPEVTDFTVFEVSHELRALGWLVPAYTMPPNLEELAVLRVVVRNGMTTDLADMLISDIKKVTDELSGQPASRTRHSSFHH